MNRTSAELRASDIMQIAASAGRVWTEIREKRAPKIGVYNLFTHGLGNPWWWEYETRGVQKVRGLTMKEQRYQLDTLDQKCLFVHIITGKAHKFITVLFQNFQALFEGLGFKPMGFVGKKTHGLNAFSTFRTDAIVSSSYYVLAKT